jgi:hypothetical protein
MELLRSGSALWGCIAMINRSPASYDPKENQKSSRGKVFFVIPILTLSCPLAAEYDIRSDI